MDKTKEEGEGEKSKRMARKGEMRKGDTNKGFRVSKTCESGSYDTSSEIFVLLMRSDKQVPLPVSTQLQYKT